MNASSTNLALDNTPEEFVYTLINTALCGMVHGVPLPGQSGGISDFRVLHCNEAFCRITGLPRQRILSETMLTYDPESRESGVLDLWREVVETGQERELDHYFAPGGCWLRQKVTPYRQGVLASFLNVTAEYELQTFREKANLLQTLIDTTQAGIVLLAPVRDEAGKITDFRYEITNDSNARIVHLPVTAFREALLTRLFPGIVETELLGLARQVVETGQPVSLQMPYFKDGVNAWFDLNITRHTSPDGDHRVLFSLMDITKAKQAEEALQRQSDLLQQIVDQTRAGITLLEPILNETGDITDFRIVVTNAYLSRVLGHSVEELSNGRSMSDLFPNWRESDRFEVYRTVLTTGQPHSFTTSFTDIGLNRWADVSVQRIDGYVLITLVDTTAVREAEQQQQRQAALLRSVLDGSQDSIIALDAVRDKDGQIVDFRYILQNEEHRRGINLSNEQLLGRTVRELFADVEETGMLNQFIQVVETGQPFQHEMQYNYLNRKGWYNVIALRRDDGLVLTVQNRTEGRRQQEQLKQALIRHESEERLRSLLMQAPVAIAIFRGPQMIIELANEQHLFFWGRSAEEVIGKPVFEAIPEAAGQGYEELLKHVLQTGKPWVAGEQYVELVRNGQREGIWVDVVYQPLREGDTVTGIMEVVHDITQQVMARQQIQASEQQFHQLADLVPQILWTAGPDGSTDYFNQQWYDFTGFQPGYGDGSWVPILHPDDVDFCLSTWKRSIQTGQYYEIEYRFADRRNPGQYRWFIGRAIPVKDAEGRVVKWFGTCTDIHDQKTLNERLEALVTERTQSLQRANLDLRRSNEYLQQFAYVASHDLQEPLRKIQSFGDMLFSQYGQELPGPAEDMLRRMHNAAERMSHLVRDLLTYSRLTTHKQPFTSVSLQEVVEGVLSDLEIIIRDRKAIVRIDSLPTVEADAVQMQQLFANLIGNSLKYILPDKPPVIRLSSRLVLAEETPAIMSTETDRQEARRETYWEISVHDNGIGFEEKYLERLFGMFQRLHGKGQYEGSGMGLAICKRVVDNHHGAITAHSQPGQGSEFIIYLPA